MLLLTHNHPWLLGCRSMTTFAIALTAVTSQVRCLGVFVLWWLVKVIWLSCVEVGADRPECAACCCAGTSACPNGVFFCRNRGHEPKLLATSFVDDGICGKLHQQRLRQRPVNLHRLHISNMHPAALIWYHCYMVSVSCTGSNTAPHGWCVCRITADDTHRLL